MLPTGKTQSGKSKAALLLIVGLAAASLLVEGLLRLGNYHPKRFPPVSLYVNHPETGWALRPGFRRATQTPRGAVTYEINSQGIRAHDDFTVAASSSNRRIFIIGDAFAFGVGVNEKKTFSHVMQERLRSNGAAVEVANLGVPSYGTLQSRKRLEEYWRKLGPADIVVYMFCSNDPIDDLTGRREVVNGVLIQSKWKHKYFLSLLARAYNNSRGLALLLDGIHKYSAKYGEARVVKRKELDRASRSMKERRDFQSLKKSVPSMIRWIKSHGARALVVSTSASRYSTALERAVVEEGGALLEGERVFLALRDRRRTLQRTLRNDANWNPAAHSVMGKAIADFLLQHAWLPAVKHE